MNMSTNRYLMIGAGCVVLGAALWYLSEESDKEMIKFDPKKHTVEELRKLVHELFVESATLYCQKVNMMRNMKKNNDSFSENDYTNLKVMQKKDMEEAEQAIYEEHKLSQFFVEDWMAKFASDPVINKYFDRL